MAKANHCLFIHNVTVGEVSSSEMLSMPNNYFIYLELIFELIRVYAFDYLIKDAVTLSTVEIRAAPQTGFDAEPDILLRAKCRRKKRLQPFLQR